MTGSDTQRPARRARGGGNGEAQEGSRRRDSIQYGGDTFVLASSFVRAAMRRGHREASLRAWDWARGACAVVVVLARLPRLKVTLTDSAGGRVIDAYLRERRRGLRSHLFARGVLTLPEGPQELYLAGRSRQAVRTNRARAEQLGIAINELSERSDVEDAARSLGASGLIDNPDALLARVSDEWLIAVDPTGEVVGAVVATIDRDWAMLNILVGSSYPARYALHTALVLKLSQMGVRHLFATNESALALPPGLQYLQRILGYEVANLGL